MCNPDVCLQVFAKSPKLENVKTRLSSALSLQERQALQTDLIRHTLDTCASIDAQLQLWGYPEIDAQLQRLADAVSATTKQQKGADLGQRMLFALNEASLISLYIIFVLCCLQ